MLYHTHIFIMKNRHLWELSCLKSLETPSHNSDDDNNITTSQQTV